MQRAAGLFVTLLLRLFRVGSIAMAALFRRHGLFSVGGARVNRDCTEQKNCPGNEQQQTFILPGHLTATYYKLDSAAIKFTLHRLRYKRDGYGAPAKERKSSPAAL